MKTLMYSTKLAGRGTPAAVPMVYVPPVLETRRTTSEVIGALVVLTRSSDVMGRNAGMGLAFASVGIFAIIGLLRLV